MIGDLTGDPETILAGAREILEAISPRGRVRLADDRAALVFETIGREGRLWVETIALRDALPIELVRHAANRSLTCTLHNAGYA